jgi:hypothetical protein
LWIATDSSGTLSFVQAPTEAPTEDDSLNGRIMPPLTELRPLPFGIDHPINESGSFELAGRPKPHKNLREVDEDDVVGEDEDAGIEIREIPIPEVDVSDLELADTRM